MKCVVLKTLICVDGLAVSEEGFLWVKRCFMPFEGFWCLPGGIVEDNESLEEAVKREFREETGFIVKVGKPLDCRVEEHSDETRIITTFHVVIQDGQLKKSEEHSKIGFCKNPPGKMVFDYFIIIERRQEMY